MTQEETPHRKDPMNSTAKMSIPPVEVEILKDNGSSIDFLMDGQTHRVQGHWGDTPEDMETQALQMVKRAQEQLIRATRMYALAHHRQEVALAAKTAAAQQKRERAAFTRAKNKDPWGLGVS